MDFDQSSVIFALGLTLFAGLSTGVGSAIAFFAKKTNTKLLSVALGFSAGVMIYISFTELLAESSTALSHEYGDKVGQIYMLSFFFGGMLLIGLIDRFIPDAENPHEIKKIEQIDDKESAEKYRKLYRMSMLTALAVALHNLPEGLATFISALNDPEIGIPIAIAIAIHNIPEGIAISIPLYYATNSRKKAFWYSFLSGLSEPIGAIIGYLLILPFISPENIEIVFGYLLAGVAGIMVYVSFDELLPAAEEYGEHHLSLYGLIGGMAVMAISLILI